MLCPPSLCDQAFENSQRARFVCLDSKLIGMNTSLERLIGGSGEEHQGRPFAELFLESDRDRIQAAIVSGQETALSSQTVSSAGETIACEVILYPVEHDDQTLIMGALRDLRDDGGPWRLSMTFSEHEYRLIYKSPIGIWQWSPEQGITYINSAGSKILGYSSPYRLIAEMDSSKFRSLFADVSRFEDMIREMVHDDEWRYLESIIHPLGQQKSTICMYARPEKQSVDRVKSVYGYMYDISHWKRAETILAGSENKYRLIAENLSDVIAYHDLETRFVFVSPSIYRAMGYRPEEVIGRSALDFIFPEDRELFKTNLSEMLEQEQSRYFQFRLIRKDGRVSWAEATAQIIHDESLEQDLIGAVTRIIDDRKEAEQVLRKSEARYRLIAENVKDMLSQHDSESRYVFVSPVCRHMLGYEPDEILGHPAYDFIYAEDHANVLEKQRELLEDDLNVYVQYRMICKDGSLIWVESSAAIAFDEVAGENLITTVTRAIDDRKNAEFELHELNETLAVEREALRRKNMALNEILDQVEAAKRRMADDMKITIQRVALPALQHLEEQALPNIQPYVTVLYDCIQKIASPFVGNLQRQQPLLSPREIEICNMIRNDLSSKEIANALNTSIQTVLTQRKIIRRKLGLTNKAINLTTYLKQMDEDELEE